MWSFYISIIPLVIRPNSQQIIAFTLLLMTLGFSLLSSVLSNISTYAKDRPHNFIRLVNETLTRLFFSYFTFFIALVLSLYNAGADIERIALDLVLAASSIVCWGISLYVTLVFSDMTFVKRVHGCKVEDNKCMNERLANARDFIKVCSINIVASIVVFLLVTGIIFFTPFLVIDENVRPAKAPTSTTNTNN